MSTVNTRERESLYAEVTSRIIAELEAGRLPWVQPWDASRCPCIGPDVFRNKRSHSLDLCHRAGLFLAALADLSSG